MPKTTEDSRRKRREATRKWRAKLTEEERSEIRRKDRELKGRFPLTQSDKRRRRYRQNKIVPRNVQKWSAWQKLLKKCLKAHKCGGRNKFIKLATKALEKDDLPEFLCNLQKILWRPGAPCQPPFPVALLANIHTIGRLDDYGKYECRRNYQKIWVLLQTSEVFEARLPPGKVAEIRID